MSEQKRAETCWWERTNVLWEGEVFENFILKDHSPQQKRIQKLRDEITNGVEGKSGVISIERAKLFTESYKQTEGEPSVIRRAKAARNVFAKLPIPVPEGQLLMGYPSAVINGAEIEPEFHCSWLDREIEIDGQKMKEVDAFPIRKFIEFHIDENDAKELKESIIPYWKDITLHEATVKTLKLHNPEALFYWDNSFTSFPVTRIGLCHTIQDYNVVITKGIKGMKEEIQRQIDQLDVSMSDDYNDLFRLNNYKAMLMVADGLIEYAHRCAEVAESMAQNMEDSARKDELLEMARICRKVPENPAETWWEAIQSFHFAHMGTYLVDAGVSHSTGRFDQYMYPILIKDLESGLSKEKAQEILECFFVTFCYRNQLVDWRGSRATPGWHTNDKITIGGVDTYGRDATNILSYMVLEAHAHVHLNDPIISVRLHNNTPDDFLRSIMEVLRISSGVPQIIIDESIIPALMGQLGLSLSEARNYADVGCQENQTDPNMSPGSDTHGHQNAGFFNLVKPVELALNNGINPRNGVQVGPKTGDPRLFETMDELCAAVKEQFEYAVKMNVIINNTIEHAYINFTPSPYHNLMHPGPRKTGIDINMGSCKYNYFGSIGTGLGTAGDSLTAIDQLVFKQKAVSMDELLKALKADWEGYESLRNKCISVPKYGMDDDQADKWAKFIADTFMDAYERHPTCRGGRYLCGFFSVTQNHVLGNDTDATPDGRKANEMLSDSTAPSQYAVALGPTATHKSATKAIDTMRTVNGITFAQNLDINSLQTERELSKWGDLIRTFVNDGGMSVQYNVISIEQLKEAQINPGAYRDLFVRIGGYTARFIDLSKTMQDSIIKKATQAC